MPAPILQTVAAVAEPRRRFGARLRALRLQAGLSQEALGQAVDMDRKTISRIEGGVVSPALDRVFLLAAALGLEPVELFTWSPAASPAAGEPPTP